MRTAQEQQLVYKIAHDINRVTPEEMQSITSDMLNSKINDGSDMSDCSVAFALALYTQGCRPLAENNNKLGSQINAETLNAVIQQGAYAGQSVAFALASHAAGQVVLAMNSYRLALRINTETLNAIIQQGIYTGRSVAFVLAWFPEGIAILAAHNNTLALRINAETLNTVIQLGPYPGDSGSVARELAGTIEGREILAAIKERHKNNKLILALYSSKIERLGKNSAIKALNRELLDGVLTMLDGRIPQKLK